jgi:6-phosphogluconolactonase
LIVGSSVPPEPPTGELRFVEDVAVAFAGLVATEFANAVSAAVDSGGGSDDSSSYDGTFRIALSGGDTARACYESLATVTSMDWPSVECFLGDERCVPPDDPAANQRLVREALLDRVRIPPRLYPIDCADLESYAALLESRPPLDLVHLGLGPDGHTASLFPGSTALGAPAGALVVPNEDPSGHNPLPRVTFSFEAIARSRLVVFTVAGASKHEALSRVLAGEDLPAARVRAPRVLWLCDKAALEG